MPYIVSDEQLESLKNTSSLYEVGIITEAIANNTSINSNKLPHDRTQNADAIAGFKRIAVWLGSELQYKDYASIPEAKKMYYLAREAIQTLDPEWDGIIKERG